MLIPLITFSVGLVGAFSVSYGAWLVYPPAGYIVSGILALTWSLMASKAFYQSSAVNVKGGK